MQVLKDRMMRLARLMAVPALALTLVALSPADTSVHAGNRSDAADVAPVAPVHAVATVSCLSKMGW